MSSRKGLLQTCDRCGASIFCEYIGKGEMDGGYTTWDKFEPAPEGWVYHTQIGLLCPACNSGYIEMNTAFMRAGRAKTDAD